jgi:antitoxin component YwqK of YwqJK toxin-antitoxin module
VNIFDSTQMNDIEITIKKTYFENTNILRRRHIVGPKKRQNMCLEWYKDGLLKYQYSFQRNKIHGPYYGWWENGYYGFIEHYKKGKLHGYEQAFNNNGSSSHRILYSENERVYTRYLD